MEGDFEGEDEDADLEDDESRSIDLTESLSIP
jgi:hypothetical protein